MLSRKIRHFHTIEDRIENIYKMVISIKCHDTITIVKKLIYTKTKHHNVKCIPHHISWGVIKPFQCTIDVLILISTVLFSLQRYLNTLLDLHQKEDLNEIIKHIKEIYSLFNEGLREYGCINPQYKLGTILKYDDIIKSANLILQQWLQ